MPVARSHLDTATTFESAAQLIMTDLRDRIGLETWAISRRDGDDQVMLSVLDDTFGIDSSYTAPWDDTFCSRVADGQAPEANPDIGREPSLAEVRDRIGFPVNSYASVPIPAPDGETLAMLCAYGLDVHPDLWAAMPLLHRQAQILGIVLSHELHLAEEIRRAERAEEAAQIDPLTRVGNRRAWDAALTAEESRASRYGTTASIVVLDLDGLKEVNDSWGHEAGDRVLSKTAEELRYRLRTTDMVARLGGDEFGILLPQTAEPEAQLLADEIVSRLAQAGVHASAGVAQRRADSGLVGAWRTADTAMYVIKQGTHQTLPARHSTPPGAHLGSPDGGAPLKSVDAVLSLVREQLGVDVAFVKRFDGLIGYFRNVVGDADPSLAAGQSEPLDSSFCSRIAAGELDEVIPDTTLHPIARELPATTNGLVGSHLGVPLRDRSGALYGTLCAYSAKPNPDLGDRDARVLRALGDVVMRLVAVEDQDDANRHSFLRRMDALIDGGGPEVVYQPIHDLENLQVVGFEALSRFPAGTPSPAQWFTEATTHGAGPALEFAALKSALATLPALRGTISLNISPATILLPEFIRMFSGIPLERFVLEITEHEAIDDYESVASILRPLRSQGLKIAVDDAGAGFASMHHILALVPDFIKLDISLVRGIDTHPARQALAASLAAFAFQTGATLVAEGIETVEELLCLRQLQIQYGQGYHLSRPSALTEQWAGNTPPPA